ncbi:MAG: hypothetical protein ACXW3M_11785, partial [Rhodoplanes sp.]
MPVTKRRRSYVSRFSIPTMSRSPPAERRTRDGIATVFMRWLANRNALRIRAREAAGLLDRSPIIMGAVDLSPEAEDLREALANALRRLLKTE